MRQPPSSLVGPVFAGRVDGQPLDVFLAGDDLTAKNTVAQLVTDDGMRAIDAGHLEPARELEAMHLERARELEAIALLHMELQGSRGTRFASAIKIVP